MATNDTQIRHRRIEVSGVEIFYREAGDPEAGAIVLLPGHPSGAHAYDGLTERLAASWHVIAPDYPGYGFSAAPADAPWTFDWLAEITERAARAAGPESLRAVHVRLRGACRVPHRGRPP